MPSITVTENFISTGNHNSFYLAAGPIDGPLMIFVDGWPELSVSWRHQLPCFAAMGFRAIAPVMRGCSRSTVYGRHEDYALETVVTGMIGLLDAIGAEKAVWVGHDWGAPVVWSIASHHPDRCHGVANLSVPYSTLERGLDTCLRLVDRNVYPEDEFPAGQWEYQRFYEEDFEAAIASFDADPAKAIKALFRSGSPSGVGKPSRTGFVRKDGGCFGGAAEPPDLPRDDDVLTDAELSVYSEALSRNGFFGPSSYYMNHEANGSYAFRSLNGDVLDMPVLFIAAEYDFTCECIASRLAEPIRDHCPDLTVRGVDIGWPKKNLWESTPHWPDGWPPPDGCLAQVTMPRWL